MSSPWSKVTLKKTADKNPEVLPQSTSENKPNSSNSSSSSSSETVSVSSTLTPIPTITTTPVSTSITSPVVTSKWGSLKKTSAVSSTDTSTTSTSITSSQQPISGSEKSPGIRGLFGFGKTSPKSNNTIPSASTSGASTITSASMSDIVSSIGAEKDGNVEDSSSSKSKTLNVVSKVTSSSSTSNSPLPEWKRKLQEKQQQEKDKDKQQTSEDEQKRIADEAVEQNRIADEAAEQNRIADEAAEQKRIADEAVEQKRIADDAVEQKRIADEAAEQKRIADEAAEQKRIADEAAEQMQSKDESMFNETLQMNEEKKSLEDIKIITETNETVINLSKNETETELRLSTPAVGPSSSSSSSPPPPPPPPPLSSSTTTSAFLSSSLQLTGAVANALADAVAQAVSRVERWQRRAEAQDRVIARLKHEMVIAGMTVSKEEREYLDEDLFEEERKHHEEETETNEVIDYTTSNPIPSRNISPFISKSSSSPSPNTHNASLNLGPNAIALLKQAGYSNQEDIDTKDNQIQEEETNGMIESVSKFFPFSDELISAVALAHAGHPEKLCAEAHNAGVIARTLKVESNVLRSVIDQLRKEHQRRISAFKSSTRDKDEETEQENLIPIKSMINTQKISKIPSLARSSRKSSVFTSPRDTDKKIDSNRFGFSTGKNEARKVITGPDSVILRSRSKSAIQRKDILSPTSSTKDILSPTSSTQTIQVTETTDHAELSLLKFQMQQLQDSEDGFKQSEQQRASVFKLPVSAKSNQSIQKQGNTKSKSTAASTAAVATRAQTIARARVDSYKKAGKSIIAKALLRNRNGLLGSTSNSSSSSIVSEDFTSPNARSMSTSTGPQSITSISYYDDSPQQSVRSTFDTFASSLESSPTTTVRIGDGGVLTISNSGKLYATHVIESPERNGVDIASVTNASLVSNDNVRNDDDIPHGLRAMLDRLANA